ncbi:MAG: hypothetical protein GY820_09365 [Gammaproteobacteria bacterium]|nr:hypothetical protein [Gammaproteobacteria bacterium]
MQFYFKSNIQVLMLACCQRPIAWSQKPRSLESGAKRSRSPESEAGSRKPEAGRSGARSPEPDNGNQQNLNIE